MGVNSNCHSGLALVLALVSLIYQEHCTLATSNGKLSETFLDYLHTGYGEMLIKVDWLFCMKRKYGEIFLIYVSDNRFKVTVLWMGPFHPELTIHHCSLVGNILKLLVSTNNYINYLI